jgi:diguanylate cyclase (GGDEF)-like protein
VSGPAGPASGSAREREGLILVVDDDADIARFIEMNLRFEGFDVMVAYDGAEALAAIERRRPDLVLLDVMMPRIDGVELCRQLRADPMTAALPVILLTAKGLSADKVLGLTAGADDYIIKPFDTLELTARVRSTLRRNREIRDVSPLTGLPGNTRILAEIAERVAGPSEYAVCYVDLDNFKTVNDVYGFFRGDQMIAALAAALHRSAVDAGGPKAFIGHIGGDDFLVVCTPEQVGPITERTLARFAEQSRSLYDIDDIARGYFEVADRQGNTHRRGLLTVSIGVALSTQRTFTDHREVVAVASEMKQVAKRSPGSVVAVDRRRDREPGRGPTARGQGWGSESGRRHNAADVAAAMGQGRRTAGAHSAGRRDGAHPADPHRPPRRSGGAHSVEHQNSPWESDSPRSSATPAWEA